MSTAEMTRPGQILYHGVDLAPLFTPYCLLDLELPTRICMAPMTREQSPGGVPGEDVAAYYTRRAAGGVGLILTEGTTVDHPVSSPSAAVPNIHEPEAIEGWKRVCSDVHAAGGKIAIQLWHTGALRINPGRRSDPPPNPHLPSFSPSGFRNKGSERGEAVGEAPNETEILEAVASFGRGAAASVAAGFDAVEVHAGHCYGPDQFAWDVTNTRTDRWGGDMRGRMTFGVEIVKAIRKAVGPRVPVIWRFSQWKIGDYDARPYKTPKDLEDYLEPLTEAGVDCFDASTRRFWKTEFEGSDLTLAGWAKKITGKAVMTIGSVTLSLEPTNAQLHPEPVVPFAPEQLVDLMRRFNRGEFDLVGVGRMLLSNPDWVNQVRAGNIEGLKPFAMRYGRGELDAHMVKPQA
jgi:2,4-dienoyl-CoA reductase-like NADH-dependent reductase (Old Yellow Enzyme family)